MSYLVTIVGPQSSGKTSAFNSMQKIFPQFKFVEEISPYTIMESDHPKYISTSGGLQTLLTKKTLAVIKGLDRDNDYIFETGLMQIVYVEKYDNLKTAEKYFKEYVKSLKDFKLLVIFVDTKPEISFKRRKNKYLKRITKHGLDDSKAKILNEYKKKISDLYPIWLKWYERIPFEKVMIKNSHKSKTNFLKEVKNIIQSFLSQKSQRP